jgi:hypothetical protein
MIAMISIGIFAKEPAADAEKPNLISVEGLVSDVVTGESLTGVKLKVEGSDIIEYSDFDGKFRIANLKPGKYTVLVEYISYDSKRIEKLKLDKNEDNSLSIKLQPSTVKLGGSVN